MSVGIKISDSDWNRLSKVSALASVRLSACLLRSAPESINGAWKGSRVAQRPDPSTSDADVSTDLAT
ncbi:hypothetical protein BHE74_00030266 [Ensete ventricosum]|nr:hypothetical protein BHE74_00030266 [Ensete ventricosum]